MRCKIFFTLLFCIALGLNAQDLSIYDSDLWVSQGADGGFHLFIRKKPDIASVLLTETTRDPSLQEDNYAYRASQWNPVNGNEYRMIDGVFIPPENNIWSLIDSTPEYNPELGVDVFHIYIPYLLNFGYEGTRHGEVYVGDGTYLNVRAFELPYGDYRGSFKDNPFLLRITQQELLGLPEDNFMKDASDAYQEIASITGGKTYQSIGPGDIVKTIAEAIGEGQGSLYLVFCIDTTASMKNDIEALKKELASILDLVKNKFAGFRVGLLLYRDYFDDYVTKIVPFTDDMRTFQKNIDGIRVRGGRDIPEAIHEAIYEAAVHFPWYAGSRRIILIGDAPPHPRPRGNITKEQAYGAALERGIRVDTILLPQ
ncbi:MAG: VWA domain-containing protein [Spirochaetaceae bacterium]|nr:VWA domain-containing protein [Spirochaetaceae bacterium]